jgi:hypothetical protein
MAAFLGVAVPLRSVPLGDLMTLYAGVVAAAITAATMLAAWWRRAPARSGAQPGARLRLNLAPTSTRGR